MITYLLFRLLITTSPRTGTSSRLVGKFTFSVTAGHLSESVCALAVLSFSWGFFFWF